MSIRKMTFSLASLILILGLVFAIAPAMAQTIDATLALDSTDLVGPGATDTIPAGGYLIIRKTDAPGTSGLPATLPSDAIVGQWAAMPDLEALFFEEGGTILLQASVTNVDPDGTVPTSGRLAGTRPPQSGFPEFRYDHDGDDVGPTGTGAHTSAVADDGIIDSADLTASPTPTAETHPASGAIDVRVDDLSITEIMWALNDAIIGQDAADDRQWIEIHNRNENRAVPLAGLVLRVKSADPPLGFDTALVDEGTADTFDAGTDASARIGVDRIENVRAVGLEWEPKGQSGSDDTTVTTDTLVPFVSMYRNRGKLGKDEGSNIGHWTASTQTYLANHKGTPGRAERGGVVNFEKKDFTLGDVIINEVSNRMGGKDYEWIELMGPAGKNLKNWEVSLLTAVNSDVALFTFPNADRKIPANGILLVVASDPSGDPNHPLAAGWNIAKNADGQVEGVGAENPDDPRHAARYIVLDFAGDGLPDDGDFVLVLRSANNKEGKNENIIDMAGWESGDLKIPNTMTTFTNLWPLTGDVRGADLSNNKLEADKVHRRQKTDIPGTRSTNYGRDGGNHADDTAFRDIGWTGVGYKRNAAATAANGGTPGYPNNSVRNDGADAIASVMISEIMYARDERNRLPQWVELRNMSDTLGMNLGSWRLEIVNHHEMMDDMGMMVDWEGAYSENVDLSGTIPPGQSYLIVSRVSARDGSKLPDARVKSAGKSRTDALLNPYGFQVRLIAKRGEGNPANRQEIDIAGNLMEAPDSRRADAQSFNADVAWQLPDAVNEDGDRISIVRIPTAADAEMPATGTDKDGWRLYNTTQEYDALEVDTYYGDETDISSPGHHHGGVLPVSLSKFRPERMRDTGQVVIRWVTESETNNAGFNILRSETRDGQFTKLNTQLIAGQGTTSERTTYQFVDTTAKPNVVYYYQIQDVSLDGDVTTLRTTHLRGNVTAAGKLTTTWSEIKTLRE